MTNILLFTALEEINKKPKPYEKYTAMDLWNDPYISKKMLEAHLDPDFEPASRKKEFIEKSIAWMTKHFDITHKTKLCDFGCGPGLYTTPLASLGADVTGIDFSERSIRYARKIANEKNLNINYVLKNYLDFSSDKKFDLITMIYCDFCALSPAQRKQLLNKFYDLLNDGGSIFMDVYSLSFFDSLKEAMIYDRSSKKDFWSDFWSDKPYFVFNSTFKYEVEKVSLSKYTIIEKERMREIFNWLQCYNLDSLKKEFQENGFEIVEHYSNVAGESYKTDSMEIAVVARKEQ
jgi:SAM-dependent methyltransferase